MTHIAIETNPLLPNSITYDNPTPETSRALVFLDACDGHPSGRGGGGRVRQTCVGTSVTELGMLESRRRWGRGFDDHGG